MLSSASSSGIDNADLDQVPLTQQALKKMLTVDHLHRVHQEVRRFPASNYLTQFGQTHHDAIYVFDLMSAQATRYEFYETRKWCILCPERDVLTECLVCIIARSGSLVWATLLMAPPQLARFVTLTRMSSLNLAHQQAATGDCMHANHDNAVQQ